MALHNFKSTDTAGRSPSNKPFRIFAFIICAVGVSALIFFAVFRFNPPLYRKVFLGASGDTPESLSPAPAAVSEIAAASEDLPEFSSFCDEVLAAVSCEPSFDINSVPAALRTNVDASSPKSNEELSSLYSNLKDRLKQFEYTSLSFKQQKAYDSLSSFLTYKYASYADTASEDAFEAKLQGRAASDLSLRDISLLNAAYLEKFMKQVDDLSSGAGRQNGFSNYKDMLLSYTTDSPQKDEEINLLVNNITSGNELPVRYFALVPGETDVYATYNDYLSFETGNPQENGAADSSILQSYFAGYICLLGELDIEVSAYGKSLSDIARTLSGYGIVDGSIQQTVYDTIIKDPGYFAARSTAFIQFLDLQRKAESLMPASYSDDSLISLMTNLGPMPFAAVEKRLYMME